MYKLLVCVLDIAFILDSSESAQNFLFERERAFVHSFSQQIMKMQVAGWHLQARLAALQFSSTVSVVQSFADWRDLDEFTRRIDNMSYIGHGTYSSYAIGNATELFVKETKYENVRVALLMTDGADHPRSPDIIAAAAEAKSHNIKIFTISLSNLPDGCHNIATLRAVASAPAQQFCHDLSNPNLEWRLLQELCPRHCLCEKGDRGPPGSHGKKGEAGYDGVPGIKGAKGEPGAPGKTGVEGREGQPGFKGDKGDRGECGAPGEKGEKGLLGPPGPRGIRGEQAQYILKNAFGRKRSPVASACVRFYNGVYLPTNSGTICFVCPTAPTFLQGLSGPPGEQGPEGQPGPKGDRGFTGAAGPQGDTGIGFPGPKGDKGNQGRPGPIGPVGAGEPGLIDPHRTTTEQGPPGLPGLQGIPGPPGEGLPGPKGDRGYNGSTGARGPPGFSIKGDKLNEVSALCRAIYVMALIPAD
ncbi:hypothetical protein NFI96_004717, partial [Prochilodus magdalenae]